VENGSSFDGRYEDKGRRATQKNIFNKISIRILKGVKERVLRSKKCLSIGLFSEAVPTTKVI
jgi:hypothetical protein